MHTQIKIILGLIVLFSPLAAIGGGEDGTGQPSESQESSLSDVLDVINDDIQTCVINEIQTSIEENEPVDLEAVIRKCREEANQ